MKIFSCSVTHTANGEDPVEEKRDPYRRPNSVGFQFITGSIHNFMTSKKRKVNILSKFCLPDRQITLCVISAISELLKPFAFSEVF